MELSLKWKKWPQTNQYTEDQKWEIVVKTVELCHNSIETIFATKKH